MLTKSIRTLALNICLTFIISACSNNSSTTNNNPNVGILNINVESINLTANDSVQTIVLTNTGSSLLTLTEMPVLESPLFALASGCDTNTTLAPQQSCSYTIAYSVIIHGGVQHLNFNYNNSQTLQTKTIPLNYTFKLYAYVLGLDVNNAGHTLFKCAVDESAHLNDCTNQGNFAFPEYNGGVKSITFANIHGTWRAYLTNPGQFSFVSGCDYNMINGDITNCSDVTGFIDGLSSANAVQFATSDNGNEYAYISAGNSYGQDIVNGIYRCDVNESGAFSNCALNYPSPDIGISSINLLFQHRGESQYIYFSNIGAYGEHNNSTACAIDNSGNVESSSCILTNFPANAISLESSYNGSWYLAHQFGGTNYQFISENYNGDVYRCAVGSDNTYESCNVIISYNDYEAFPSNQFDMVGGINGTSGTYLFYPTQNSEHTLMIFLMSQDGSTVTLDHEYANTDFESINQVSGIVIPQPNAN